MDEERREKKTNLQKTVCLEVNIFDFKVKSKGLNCDKHSVWRHTEFNVEWLQPALSEGNARSHLERIDFILFSDNICWLLGETVPGYIYKAGKCTPGHGQKYWLPKP